MNVTACEEHGLIRKSGFNVREREAKGVCGEGTFKMRLAISLVWFSTCRKNIFINSRQLLA